MSTTKRDFAALFDPKGVIVAGASSHPGKFGFVALHNLLAAGYKGNVFATNLEGTPVLGLDTVADIDELPDGEADLVFVCTPARTNIELLRKCAAKGVRAAFLTSAGYGEAGPEGKAAQDELVRVAGALGILLAGPNGQGVISTPASMCAQIVAPYPPPGRIGIASQSGNFVSSFMNYARHYGVGVSRAVSAGNAAAVTVPDFLDYYADDPETDVGLAYVEGITDGRAFFERMRSVAERMPLVVVKGGTSDVGARAAASHTGSLATDDRVFDGACRQAGVVRAATIEEAYEAAATFATQPLPEGPNVCVVSTAGGWGVVTADAISRTARPHVASASRRPEGRARPTPSASLEPQQSNRHGRRRDEGHHPDGARGRGAPSRGRRRRLPRHGHPGQPGAHGAGRAVLSGPRPRTDRRLSRTTRPPLHRDGRRALEGHREADPHGH